MICELKENELERTSSLFKDLSYNLTVDAIIEGNRSGKIYVDNITTSKTAFAWAPLPMHPSIGQSDIERITSVINSSAT